MEIDFETAMGNLIKELKDMSSQASVILDGMLKSYNTGVRQGRAGAYREILSDLRGLHRLINAAVNEHCTCGGGGPDDGCAACKIFHAVADQDGKLGIMLKYQPKKESEK